MKTFVFYTLFLGFLLSCAQENMENHLSMSSESDPSSSVLHSVSDDFQEVRQYMQLWGETCLDKRPDCPEGWTLETNLSKNPPLHELSQCLFTNAFGQVIARYKYKGVLCSIAIKSPEGFEEPEL